jgi:putative intracellular protease/amidase
MMKRFSVSLVLLLAIVTSSAVDRVAAAPAAAAARRGKVLIVMSGAHQLSLRDGKKYDTGYYLDELAIPLRKLLAAGYTPVFASPNGETPSIDASSKNKMFFGNQEAALTDALALVAGTQELQHPRKLAAVLAEGTDDYVGLLIPGGHAPMEDLMRDRALGKILVAFHSTARPTGVICHAPAVLLSALADPAAFHKAMASSDYDTASKLAVGWPYAGYRLTVFSTHEEQVLEGAGRQLGGAMLFYAAGALAQAGAHVDGVAAWQSNVIEDRELVSGQQPLSADAFGDAFVAKLNRSPKKH